MEAVNGYQEADKSHSKRVSRACLVKNIPSLLRCKKKLIGGRFVDVSVQSGIRLRPFKVISRPTDKLMIVVNYNGGEKPFTAKKNPFCEDAHSQRLAAKQAAALAGLNTLRIVDEHVCNPVLAEIYLAVCAVGNDVNLSSEWQ
ncbi:HEAT SHOCK PROTEIN 70KDA [Salix viminalis]|uniref:HEAT SHOCK PROTEIN 70KDA n=1 Tax=Salix viminalis TaxID=40686 RepID=A0A9Q0TZ15_SALVM|nr:HEAT SHOCK PROTEIN 70KDA [Salix viminalis]